MRMARTFAAMLLSTPAVAGCLTTAAVHEADNTRATIDRARAESSACHEQIDKDPRFAPIRAKSARFSASEDPTMTQLTDTSKPTAEHARLVSEFHDRSQPCRRRWLAVPGLTGAYTLYYAKLDVAYAALVRREITWGEANGHFKQLSAEIIREHERVGSQYDRDLQRRHEREIDAIPRPIRCTRVGSSITCI